MTKKFVINSSLTNGLNSMFDSVKSNNSKLYVEFIPISKIKLDPNNPRNLLLNLDDVYKGLSKDDEYYDKKKLEKHNLESLAKSIQEQGIINPITVYKFDESYCLIAGERRTLASILANKTDIPARVLETCPDQLSLSLIQWVENIEREDLSLSERLFNLEKILMAYANTNQKSFHKISPSEISKLIGCSLQQGVNYRHALDASEKLKEYIKLGKIKNIEKVAFITKSPVEIQDHLIENCSKGATLKILKKLVIQKVTKIKSKEINYGYISNSNVAKIIINSILKDHELLKNDKLKDFSTCVSDNLWQDNKSIVITFKKLIQLLEQL